jgi:excinuclease ABC subunit A
LYLLDEPTTGLHFDDMNKLLHVIHRLADLGNTVIVIEHNLDIIKNADWIVDLGPEAGDNGGYLLFEGTPEELVNSGVASHTANALAPVLKNGQYLERVPFDPASLENLPEDEIATTEIDAEMPWEKNGIKWHTQDRICRNGNKIKWDGKILQEIVNRIESTEQFAPTNWNHRSVVEICAERKTLGWFMRATTSNEWFLHVKFRTAGGTFKRDQLIRSLDLPPFSKIDEVQIYGDTPRVKVERQTIQWQEIELFICLYKEIDRPEFYDFLDRAIQGFRQFTKQQAKSPENYMPWHVLGEKWHLLQRGFANDNKIAWKPQLLTEIFNILKRISSNTKFIWTNKTHVEIYRTNQKENHTTKEINDNNTLDQKFLWVVVWTKQNEAVSLDITVASGAVTFERIKNLGDNSNIKNCQDHDIIRLNFTNEVDLPKLELQQLLTETF